MYILSILNSFQSEDDDDDNMRYTDPSSFTPHFFF